VSKNLNRRNNNKSNDKKTGLSRSNSKSLRGREKKKQEVSDKKVISGKECILL
jgi:hypothetical protein